MDAQTANTQTDGGAEHGMTLDPGRLDAWAVAAQGGDREAFVDLMMACHRELQAFLAARSPSVDMVDELVQSTFITAYARLATYQPMGTFLSWLKGIGRNHQREALRERSRYVHAGMEDFEALLARRRLADIERGEDDEGERRNLGPCLDGLAPAARALITERYLHGRSLKEIAGSLAKSVNWVAVNLHRVREALRACLGRAERSA